MRTLVRFRNAFCVLAMIAHVSVIRRVACVLAVILGVLGTTVRIVSLTWLAHTAMLAQMAFMDLPRITKTANVSKQAAMGENIVPIIFKVAWFLDYQGIYQSIMNFISPFPVPTLYNVVCLILTLSFAKARC